MQNNDPKIENPALKETVKRRGKLCFNALSK
jgi:hypothetical protein